MPRFGAHLSIAGGIPRAVDRAVAHASCLINLGTAEPALRARSIGGLGEELDRAERLGLDGLVLHPGAAVGGTEEDALRLLAEAAAEVFTPRRRQRVTLLFEHTAGQGSSLGWRFDHLRTLIERLDGAPRVGVCLDTCHLLAAGYDWRSPSGYRATVDAFDTLVGFDRLKVMHLNGSIAFRRLVNDPRLAHMGSIATTCACCAA